MEWLNVIGFIGVLYFLSAITNGTVDNIQQTKDIKVVLEGINVIPQQARYGMVATISYKIGGSSNILDWNVVLYYEWLVPKAGTKT